jgi:hypothetical protein
MWCDKSDTEEINNHIRRYKLYVKIDREVALAGLNSEKPHR